MKRKGLFISVIVFFSVIALVSIINLVSIMMNYKKSEKFYETIENEISIASSEENTQTEEYPTVNFSSLIEMNPDCIGWIYIPDTNINYPVVQGDDNEYYIDHLFDGKKNASGSIFLDCEASFDFSDRHSFMYGHHMNDGSMFSELLSYKKPGFYSDHSKAFLITPEKTYTVEFFAGYVSDVYSEVWNTSFSSDEEFRSFIEDIKKKSYFKSDIKVDSTSRILTLATCSYEFNNARFLLSGVINP